MSWIHHVISAIILFTVLLAAQPGFAQEDDEITVNVGLVSNYLFRGVSQTDDGPAVQGGLDYSHASGFSGGFWLSNVDFGEGEEADAEVDLYLGYGRELGETGFSWDTGTVLYHYPGGGNIDYAEAWFNVSFGLLTGGLAWTYWGEAEGASAFDSGDLHYSLSLDLPLEWKEIGFTAFAGYYDFKEDGNPVAGDDLSYAHWGLSAARSLAQFGSLSLTYEQTDGGGSAAIATDDKPSFWLGWTIEF